MNEHEAERIAKGFIISHSESGHHHLLTGGDVMERTNSVPAGPFSLAISEGTESSAFFRLRSQ